MQRRRALAALLALGWARRALAQPIMNPAPGIDARTINTPEGALRSILDGATMHKGRVHLELPPVAENGHSVGMTVRMAPPTTAGAGVAPVRAVVTESAQRRIGSSS